MTQGAFPGPAIAVTPTNQNLALGPRGKPGPQGPQGVAGPVGPAGSAQSSAPVAPTIWTATTGVSGGPTYQYPSHANYSQNFDTTLGAISVQPDASPLPGQIMGLQDVGQALGSNALTLVTGGAQLEYPPGTISSANRAFTAIGGGGPLGPYVGLGINVSWVWFVTASSSGSYWKCG